MRGKLIGDPVFTAPVDELLAQTCHDLFILLPHCLAEDVSLGEREPGELLRHLHHLILIDRETVRLLEDLLQVRMRVVDLLAAAASLHVVIGHPALQRTRTIQGEESDQILEPVRLHAADEGSHPRTFELEDPRGLPLADHPEGLLVVEWDRFDVDVDPGPLVQGRTCLIDQGEVPQPQEVELQEADRRNIVHVKLGDDLAFAHAQERDMVEEWIGRYHHPSSVSRGVTRQSLETPADIDYLFD